MRTLVVEMDLAAPPERVFDALADHAGYGRFRPIGRAQLLRRGEPAPNGVGAVRRLWARGLVFDEEITAFERPARLDYVIRRLTVAGRADLPFEHEGGSIRVSPSPAGSRVEWTTRYRVPTPLVGAPLTSAFAAVLRRSFTQMLEDAERLAGAS